VVFAAINGGEHSSQYQVNDMDPAELDRYTVFDVEPTVEDWLEWAKDHTHVLIWDFINQNRNHLEHTDDFDPNKVYPSRRSWKRANDCLAEASLFDEKADLNLLFNLSTAFVGFEASVAFLDFCKSYDRQVTWEEIVNEGAIEKTEKFDINEHAAMVEKMEAADVLSTKLAEEQLDNLAAYFESLPAEVAMKLWHAVGKQDGEKKENIVRFHSRIRTTLVKLLS